MPTPANPGDSGPTGPVPADNQPGHHPEHEQDQPDLDAFARRLSIAPEPAGSFDEFDLAHHVEPGDLGVADQLALVRRIGRLGVMLGVAVVVRAADVVATTGRSLLDQLDADAVREVDLEVGSDRR
jgi:hypothetical protein